ncbi:GyrI-like domain-containing protein [Sutcliffiella horikoshii]|uniref:GyrI-like domain-containing protein n=1 Tax=Sutcliffiella horikoshii TaxID=79883 RepID=UPI001F3751AD|nr:GyrI-like domain-containing protein [Sutcliffiella horikoshii]MCG1020794.1 transcriptional regulator [Sutcliffiella horikoshii]
MKTLLGEIVNIPSYRAMGVKWEGSYAEVPKLKEVILHMSDRVNELLYVKNPKTQLGLSYHLRSDGFVHYSVFEVDDQQELQPEMVEIIVPEMTYLKVTHPKGKDIGATYTEIYQWFKECDYRPLKEKGIEYYDDLPIKHERYPIERDLEDPHFEIFIPVLHKS